MGGGRAFAALVVSALVWHSAVAEAADFALLHSTLGYELAATKRALVRPHPGVAADIVDAAASRWELVDTEGTLLAKGRLAPLGRTFGISLFEIDFSDAPNAGTRMVRLRAEIQRTDGAAAERLESLPFEIGERLHFRRTFRKLSLANAEARAAPAEAGGGFYDCNSKLGETHSHGVFLAGLAHGYAHHQVDLSETERLRLRRAAAVAVDYLLASQAKTGRFSHQHRDRPFHLSFTYGVLTRLRELVEFELPGYNAGPHNTQKAAYGLATYLHVFRELDPDRAPRVEASVRKALAHLHGEGTLSPRLESVLAARLYGASGAPSDAAAARAAIDLLLQGFDLAGGPRGWYRDVPYFEGLQAMLALEPDGAATARWRAAARRIARGDYAQLVERNGFRVAPVGERFDWQHQSEPPRDPGSPFSMVSSHLLATATDALLLADITGEAWLEAIATGHLGWITGLHPGIPGRLARPPTSAPLASAAFIYGLDARHAAAWNQWEWDPPAGLTSIVNGFSYLDGVPFAYTDDRYEPSETFITYDGAYLHAVARYDALLRKLGHDRISSRTVTGGRSE